MCGFSFGMLFSSPLVIQDSEYFSNPKSSAGEITIVTPGNYTYIEPDSGYYPGTYGFEDELGQIYGSNIRFIDEYQGYSQSTYCLIKSIQGNRSGHMDTMVVSDAQAGSYTWGVHNFDDPQSNGTIEFYLWSAGGGLFSALERQDLQFRSSDNTIAFRILNQLHDDKIMYYDGSSWQEFISVIDEEWYHHSINFDCEAGIKGQFTWIITDSLGNEVGRVENIEFENDLSTVDEMYFGSRLSDYGYGGTYWDAFGFSWDPNYNIGDNINEGLLLGYDSTIPLQWQGYSLDGKDNVTISGNYTIPVPVNGTHSIQVFGTDSIGTTYESNIRHFTYGTTLGPEISIISPDPNSLYSDVPPDFNITIEDPDYNFTWYSLDGGSTNIYSNETTGTIDQSEWDKQGDGSVTITFYANNSLGIINQAEVTVRKDILAPFIGINSPVENQLFGVEAPTFFLLLVDQEIDSTWYTLDSGNINISFSDISGIIDQTEWEKKGGGAVPIRFYANDTFGKVGFSDVIVIKDLTSPIITINLPSHHELFGTTPPNFTISITELNPESMWYTLDSGATNVTFSSLNGTINQAEWDKQGNGTVTIRFYARDEVGNEGSAEIILRRDISTPAISINDPISDDIFGLTPPQYNISVAETNIDSMWYTLDAGITIISFTEFTGTIEQTEWEKFGNGTLIITFFVNDTIGNLGQASVRIQKDILDPIITINSPQDDDVFGFNAPTYDISIEEYNLDSMWYSLDYGVTVIPIYSFTGTIDQIEWETKSSEAVPIRFYANDSMGHESFTEVLIIKDVTIPIITINSPSAGQLFGQTTPDYDISILELNLESYWYTLDDGVTNISVSSFAGSIDQAEWDNQGNGTVTVRFYARDEGGNENFAEIIIRKKIIAPIITINSPLYNEIYESNSPSYNVTINDPNLDSMWYSLDDGITIIFFTEVTGIIEQTEWNKLGNGTVTMKFFANDTLGNENYQEVTFRKDITAPIITIISPALHDIYGLTSPNYDITVTDFQLDSMWYTIDTGLTILPIISLIGTVDQAEWDKKQGGSVTIRFYANDTLGNMAYSEVVIIKDILYGIDFIELLTPSTYSQITNNFLNFSWSSLDAGFGAVNFTLQVSDISDFTHIVFQSENIAETTTVTNYSVPLSLTQGQYYWRVRATYENYNGSWSNYFSFHILLNDYSPSLVFDEYTPTNGTRVTIFRFTVFYTDLDNNAPESVEILINGISYFMEMVDPLDEDFTDGCLYQYLTLLTPSTTAYTFSFECSDGGFQYSTSMYQGPLVKSDSAPSNNQGEDDLNSANIFAIAMLIGIPIGILIPIIVFAELKVKKSKSIAKISTKIKKKGIKS